MKTGKLITLLQSFSADDVSDLRKFIQSPFFNKHPAYLKLLNAFAKKGFYVGKDEVDKESIFEEVFPGEAFSDLKLRHICSDFLEQIETFIAVRSFVSNDTLKQAEVLRFYSDEGLDKHFTSTQRKLFGTPSLKSPNDEQSFLQSYISNTIVNKYIMEEDSRGGKNIFKETMDSLDKFYLQAKLRLCCEIVNYSNIIAIDPEIPLVEEIMALLPKSPHIDVPVIRIYRDILLGLTDGDEKYYYSLKESIAAHSSLFNADEARNMHFYALNYCVKRINEGQTGYLAEIFEWYKRMLGNELLLENGELSPSNYKNIVVTALRQGQYAWALDFIKKYKEKIEEVHRENAYTYNLAKYYFYVKEYSKVMKLLNAVEYEDVFYNLDSKAMLLKTYYECNDVRSLFSLMDSFKTYLQRNKLISPTHKEVYSNLVKFTRKLADIQPRHKEEIAKLRNEISHSEAIADVSWLQDKLEELER